MGYNNVGYLVCTGCGFKGTVWDFTNGICPICKWEGQLPIEEKD